MKYYKTPKFAKVLTSTGFITMFACLLIAIGAIGWFTLSRNNKITETPGENNLSLPSYPDTDSSYNGEVTDPLNNADTPITDVDDDVTDVPYNDDTISVTPAIPEEETPSFVLPVTGNISKGYSDTALQYSATYNDMRLHTAVDILCEKNSNIKSVGSGTVKSVFEDANYGKVITIEYATNITVKYCGMGSVNVNENDNVSTGDIIGTSGEIPAECADNPHIHIEVYVDDQCTAPLEALGLE